MSRICTRFNSGSGARRRSSQYRGVTKHRRSGRWEAHIWIKEIGRQVYLGGYEKEEHAAEAFDVAAIKCKGRRVKTNFDASRYADLTECMSNISLEELIMAVRRQSQGFSRGTSSYRGVTHHPSGRWESRIGIPGSKHIYLGLYRDEAEAARAYDQALVRLRGASASTNFALSDYRQELAEYHRMQQAVLMGDDSWAVYMNSGAAYEAWIKHGGKDNGPRSSDQHATSSNEEQTALPAIKLNPLEDNKHRAGGRGLRDGADLRFNAPNPDRSHPPGLSPQKSALQSEASSLNAGELRMGQEVKEEGGSEDLSSELLVTGFTTKGPRRHRTPRSNFGRGFAAGSGTHDGVAHGAGAQG